MQVLLRLDAASVGATGDYPLAWAQSFGAGRAYYNALGHFPSTWMDPRFQRQLAQMAAFGHDPPRQRFEQLVREGQPAEILLELARDARLLVVGSRGRGGFAGLLLGSVSQQCAQHARCPVTIVRAQ